MLRYCADGLTGEGHRWLLVRWYNGAANQAETAAREALAITADPAGDARLPLAILAQIASAIETTTRPQSWRHPDPTTIVWLRFLAAQGYELAPIEQHIIDNAPTPATPGGRPDDGPDLAGVRRRTPGRRCASWSGAAHAEPPHGRSPSSSPRHDPG